MIIKRNTNKYSISCKLTEGKLLALRRALELYEEQCWVGDEILDDLYNELTNTIEKLNANQPS